MRMEMAHSSPLSSSTLNTPPSRNMTMTCGRWGGIQERTGHMLPLHSGGGAMLCAGRQ